MISRQGYAETAGELILVLLGGSWDHVGAMLGNFSDFFQIFGASQTILQIFGAFEQLFSILYGFGRIWG